jgi:hypothetical protein
MRFATLVAGLSSLSLSSAIITGFSVPDTIKPGDRFNLVINTANYIQSVYDVSVAFGIAAGSGYQGALGNIVDSFDLGPSRSNIDTPINEYVTVPNGIAAGPALFTATFYSLFGAELSPSLTTWNVSVTIGDTTSGTRVTSTPS